MKREHCNFCDAVIDEHDGESIVVCNTLVDSCNRVRAIGNITLRQRISMIQGRKTANLRQEQYLEGGAWCSLDHLIQWLLEKFN